MYEVCWSLWPLAEFIFMSQSFAISCLSLADEKPDDSMANLLTHSTKYFYVAFCVSSDHL